MDEAYEQKHLRNAELSAEAQRRGWHAEVRPVEVRCRGFVATFTTMLLIDLGITGQRLHSAIKVASEAAERSIWWLCRQDPAGP